MTENSAPHILIVGSGSVGKRHARNLAALGCRISCTDPRPDRRAELDAEVSGSAGFPDPETAFATHTFDGAVIASPTSFHVAQAALALERGCPVLLEKPVAPDLAGAEALLATVHRARTPLLLGYTWRWWPPLAGVRRELQRRAIGTPIHVQFHMSAHLADWHPWERYQDFFMAKKSQGGGALLDESHWIDLMLWLFGMPDEVSGRIERLSGLEIDSDDNVDLLFAYGSGLRVTMHLDLYGRPHEKFIRFVGSEGTLLWSADPNRTTIGHTMAQDWQGETHACERNDMFVAVTREFLDVVAGEPPRTCRLEDGVSVMKVIEAARQASRTRATVALA